MLANVAKRGINGLLGQLGLRVINKGWGPRGFAAVLKQLTRLGETPQTVIDIGAASGTWYRECRKVLPHAEFFLIDPLVNNERHLAALCDQNSKASYWMGAIGATSGQQTIWRHGDQSSFLESEYSRSTHKAQHVELKTLDSFLGNDNFKIPDFLKADVQGYELEVLRGARQCLQHARLLLLELSIQEVYDNVPLAHEVISEAGRHGFRIYDICSYSQRPHDGQLAQCDVMFLKPDSAAFKYHGWQ